MFYFTRPDGKETAFVFTTRFMDLKKLIILIFKAFFPEISRNFNVVFIVAVMVNAMYKK